MRLNPFLFLSLSMIATACPELSGQIAKQESRFTIGAFYNPSVNTYSVFGDANYGNDALVKSHTGHNYGILSSYKMSKRISAQSGVGISDFGYEMEYSGRYYSNGLYRYNVGYIEVPLEFRIIATPLVKRLKVVGSIGGFIAFLTKSKRGNPEFISGTTQINLTNFDNFSVYAPTIGGLNIGVALSYHYTDKIILEFQPITKIFFGKNTYSPLPGDNEWTHISSTGFRISINYKLPQV
jgi:hypothetical protein